MTTDVIVESNMRFGPYPQGQCFYIEKSRCYEQVQEGVQMAEFLLLRQVPGRPPTIWVVEAKSSSPKPGTKPNFAEFIDEIRAKLTNGFLLSIAARLQRHPDSAELPEPFKKLDLRFSEFRFVLVINGHKEAWLEPLQNALALALKPVVKTWALSPLSVAVLNHEMAQKYGLILPVAAVA